MTTGPDGEVFVNNRDRGSGTKMCDDFMQHEMTLKAGLTLEEVIALRLYTGPAFQKYNQHLRGLNEARMEKVGSLSLAVSLDRSLARSREATKGAKKERQYTTTIHAIASALKKVAWVTPLPEVLRLSLSLSLSLSLLSLFSLSSISLSLCLSFSLLSLYLSLSLLYFLSHSLTVGVYWNES